MTEPTRQPTHPLKWSCISVTGKLAFFGARGKVKLKTLLEACDARLVEHVTRKTTHLVVGMNGWPLLKNGQLSMKLKQAEALRKRGHKITILPEKKIYAMLSGDGSAQSEHSHKAISRSQVLALTGAKEGDLRLWEQLGLIAAENEKYDFQDVVSLKSLITLIQEGVRTDVIAGSMALLSQMMPDVERPLSQLELIKANASQFVTRLDGQLLRPSGQLIFDFDGFQTAMEASGEVTHITAEFHSDVEKFEQAVKYEADEDYDAAIRLYQTILDQDISGHLPEAAFNLGNIYRTLGRHADAHGMYESALKMDPDYAEAWYNLADIQEEIGKVGRAIESLNQALKIDPMYGDAHFNLALLLEAVNRRGEARKHWRRFLQIAPFGEWAEIASSYLDEASH